MLNKKQSRVRRTLRYEWENFLLRRGLVRRKPREADGTLSLTGHETLVLTWPERIPALQGKETLVVTGASRGGTSFIAYALLAAGYPLARSAKGALTHEDSEISHAFGDSKAFRRLIAERNAAAAQWGFKLPDAVYAWTWLAAELRAPIFVIAFRNPLAIARSKLSRGPFFAHTHEGFAKALHNGLDMLDAGAEIARAGVPAILVDVDRAQAQPTLFLRELFGVLGHRIDTETLDEIAKALGSSGYKMLPKKDG